MGRRPSTLLIVTASALFYSESYWLVIKNDLRLLLLSLVGGALNGIAYCVVVLHLHPFLWVYPVVLGAMFGLLCAPIVMYALNKKVVISAAKILLPVSTSVTLVCAVLIPPPLSIAFSIGGFILVTLILRFCAKEIWGRTQCQVCGYSLHSLIEPRCPECATPFDMTTLRETESGQ